MMKKGICILSGFLLLFIYSCHTADDNSNAMESSHTDTVFVTKEISIEEKKQSIDSLINLAKTQGDINAYKQVHIYYATKLKDQEMLMLSFLMAHKYNYNYAYFTVYTTFANQDDYGLKKLDIQSQNLALYYLLRSYELGYKDALYSIEEEFGENKPFPKSSYYLNKMIEYNSKK